MFVGTIAILQPPNLASRKALAFGSRTNFSPAVRRMPSMRMSGF